MKLYILHILLIIFGLSFSQATSISTNCYDCADKKTPHFMCITGKVSPQHHYEGACCPKGDTSPACTPSSEANKRNFCSPVFVAGHTRFWKFCPMTSPLIAPKSSRCTKSVTSFTAGQTPQHFAADQMRRDAATKVYDACVYTVQVPEHTFANGTMMIRFAKTTGLKVKVNYGAGENLAESSLPPKNVTVGDQVQYEVPIAKAPYMSITALPDDGVKVVALEFEYWIDGVQLHPHTQFWRKLFSTRKGQVMFVVGLFCVLMCCVLCGCCIVSANKHANEVIKGADEENSRFREVDPAEARAAAKKSAPSSGGAKGKDGFNEFESELTNLAGDDIEKDSATVPVIFSKDGVQETTCLQELKQQLSKKKDMTIEELFRICDADYKHEVSTSLFRRQIKKFNLDVKPKSIDRILSVLDEDCNGSISLKELQFALEAYGSVGEPVIPGEGEVGFQYQAVFKLCQHMASKRLNEEQMFNIIDVDKNLVLNLDEMTTIISALGQFKMKEIHLIHRFLDIDNNGSIDKAEFMTSMRKISNKFKMWKHKNKLKQQTKV